MKRAMLLSGLLVLLVGCTSRQHAFYPIDQLQSQDTYTVAAMRFYDIVDEDTGEITQYGCNVANGWAKALRSKGHDAHVADLGTDAIVAVGSYPNREAAERAAEGIEGVLRAMGGSQAGVRSTGAPGGQKVSGFRPGPYQLERLRRMAKELAY